MAKTEYTDCMRPYMTGQKEPEQRRLDFCVGAKICSGKAPTPEEAKRICLLPKPAGDDGAKPEGKGRKRKFNPRELALCLIENIGGEELTVQVLAGAIASCQVAKKPYGKKQFIKDCIKENAVMGSMQETAKLYKQCRREWEGKNDPAETS